MKYLRENELFCYSLEKILSEKYKYTSLSIEIHHMKDALQTLFSNMNTCFYFKQCNIYLGGEEE